MVIFFGEIITKRDKCGRNEGWMDGDFCQLKVELKQMSKDMSRGGERLQNV